MLWRKLSGLSFSTYAGCSHDLQVPTQPKRYCVVWFDRTFRVLPSPRHEEITAVFAHEAVVEAILGHARSRVPNVVS